MHSSRRSLELGAAFAQRHGMQFRFSYIPANYPFQGPLNLKPSAERALFDYGARCAMAGRLWLSLEQAVDAGQQAVTSLPRESQCPLAEAPR